MLYKIKEILLQTLVRLLKVA